MRYINYHAVYMEVPLPANRKAILLRVSPQTAGKIKHLSENLVMSQTQVLNKIIENALAHPDAQNVLSMNHDRYWMQRVENRQAGLPDVHGVDLFPLLKQ